jgi:mono/diheme cytochrome c family protein
LIEALPERNEETPATIVPLTGLVSCAGQSNSSAPMPAVNGRLDGAQHWCLATEVRDDLSHHHAEHDIAVL